MRRICRFRFVSAAIAFLLLIPLVLAPGGHSAQAAGIPSAPFPDVFGTRYEQSVGALHALGVVQGLTPTSFGPNQPVTRAQLVAFVLRALSIQPGLTDITPAFADVPPSHWAAPLIGRASAMGFVTGNQGRFRPDDPVTFAEVVTVLIRALGYETPEMLSNWPVGHVLKAQDLGLLQDTQFSAALPAYRGEVALMITNWIFRAPMANNGLTLSQSTFRILADLQITPVVDLISTNTLALGVEGIDWYGKTFPTQATWRAVTQNARVTSDGNLTISGSGLVTVEAAVGPINVQRSFHQIKSLQISAASGQDANATRIQMQAVGLRDDNATVTLQGIKWTAGGPGTINPDSGLLTITGPGTISVTAAWGNVKNTTQVQGATATTLRISPQSATALPGQIITFELLGDLSNGQTMPLTAQWAVISGDGTITSDGQFVSGPSGAGAVVQATYGSQKLTATVTGTSTLQIAPDSLSLVLGDQEQLAAQLQLANGAQNVTAQWTVSPPGLGSVNATGLFTAAGVGTGTLKATYNGKTASIPVTVAGSASVITVSLSVYSATANGNSTVTVTAQVTDALGNPSRSNVSQLFFSLANPNLGTLSSYLVPFTDGQAQATFTAGLLVGTEVINVAAPPGTNLMAGSATLTLVAPTAVGIALSATPATLAADGLSQSDIKATVLDQNGRPMVNNAGTLVVPLVTDGTAAGVLLGNVIYIYSGQSSGTVRFRAGSAPGITTIGGSGPLPVQSIQMASVIVGPAAQLGVRTSAATAPADGTTAITINVDVQDTVGHQTTGDNTSAVVLTLSGPNGVSSLGTQVVSRGSATFTLTQQVAGIYTLTAVMPGNPNVSQGQAGVTFTAGAAAKLALTLDPPTGILSADNNTVAYLIAQVQDTKGNAVESANIPVTFSKLSNTGAIKGFRQTTVNTDANGQARLAIYTSYTARSEQFVASAPGLPNSSNLVVTTQATGRAVGIRVQPFSVTTVSAGQTVTVRVYVVDSAGRLVTSNTGTPVTLGLSGSGSTSDSPQTTRYGVATFSVTPSKAGNLTITAQASGLAPDVLGATLAVTAGATDHIELQANTTAIGADGTSQLTFRPVAVDASGNPTGQAALVTLSLSDTTIGSLSTTTVSAGNTVVFRSSHIPGVTRVIGASTVPVVPLNIETYVAGAPTAAIVGSVDPITAGSIQSPVTVTVRIVDGNGRTITSLNSGAAGVSTAVMKVTTQGTGTSISVTGGNYSLPPGVTAPEGRLTGSAPVVNGVATFSFADTVAETVTLTPVVSVNGFLLTTNSTQIVVNPGAAAGVRVSATPAMASASTRTTVQVTATMQDSFGNPVSAAGDTFTFTLSTQAYLTPTSSLTAVAGPTGATLTLYTRGAQGVTTIAARSSATGLSSALPLVFAVDQAPATPTVTVSGLNGASVLSSEAAFKVTVTTSARISAQQLYIYLNGAQVPLYADTAGTALLGAIPAGTATVTGYVLRTNWGTTGSKILWAYTQNGLGTSGISNQVQFNIL